MSEDADARPSTPPEPRARPEPFAPSEPRPAAPMRTRRAVLGARLRVVAWLGLGPGLVEGASLVAAAESTSGGLRAGGVGLGLWCALAWGLGLPFLLGGLSPWVRARPAAHGPENPGPLASLLGVGATLLPGLWAAWLLLPVLNARVAPGSRVLLALAVGVSLPALSVLAAPAVASLLTWLVPRRLRGAGPRLALLGAATAGAALVLPDVDDRLTPLAAAPLAAGLAALSARWATRIIVAAALAALAGGGFLLARLADADRETVLGPAPSGLLYGAVVPALSALSDDDGDGFGDAFGGDDCDDDDPAVNPAARDIMRNGRDENCRGGDLTAPYSRPSLAAPPSLPAGPPPHIVLLVVDSMRADSFGPESHLTPVLDGVVARGTRFTRVFAQSSATRFSVPALLSGRWLAHTEYKEKLNAYTVEPSLPSLPAVLAALGYRTGAVVPSIPHTQMPWLRKGFGTFDVVDTAEMRRRQDHTTPTYVEHILKVFEPVPGVEDKPVFVYAHLMDAHQPYRQGLPRVSRLSGPKGDYQNEIARLDGDLAPLMAAIERLRQTRPVVLAVTADHGEGFMEHGTRYHARDLYQTSLDVPLVLEGPGIVPGGRVDTPVDFLDLAVTLAEFGGATLPGAHGSSLRGLLAGTPDPTVRPLFAELRVWRLPYPHSAAVLEWPWKLIVRLDTGHRELYDLSRDPGERRNRWADTPAFAERLDKLLSRWSEYGNGPAGQLLPEGRTEN